MRTRTAGLAAAGILAVATLPARAEPIFISRQYTRCTTCHYSPTGGGLLTPYGRALSQQELSTWGKTNDPAAAAAPRESGLLWGLPGDALGPVSLQLELRPAHLSIDAGGFHTNQNMMMTADLVAAFRAHDWTVYGEIGRQIRPEGDKIDSYEYWVGHQKERGFGARVGRFLPAYGIRLADHTALSRSGLGFDIYDQVYGLELSRTGAKSLWQVSVGPGRADSILHDDGRRAFTATARAQFDLGSQSALVVSGLVRNSSTVDPKNGAGGLAFGISPLRRLSVWTEGDVQLQQGAASPAYILVNETAFEAFRGLWLKFSPQLRTEFGDGSAGVVRALFEADLLPRTHWNVDLSFYRDRNRSTGFVTRTFLAQLHLYI